MFSVEAQQELLQRGRGLPTGAPIYIWNADVDQPISSLKSAEERYLKRDLGHSRVPVRHFDVRLREIIALEKKRFVSTFGKSIGTAVPDI